MNEHIQEERSRRQYEAIRAFYVHVLVFVPVIALLAVIDIVTGGSMWVHWVGLGWGIGVLAHGYAAFVLTPRQLATWEQNGRHSQNGAT